MNLIYFFLYDLAIQFYLLAIRIASPFNSKAKLWLSGRKKLFDELKKNIPQNDYIVWMHCASIGEYEQGRPVIEKLRFENKNVKILLTFFSPSGYEQRKKISDADYIFYMPIDTKRNAQKFVEITNPRLVIFVKYEFWLHHLLELANKNIPTILISGIFRKEQFLFKWYGNPMLLVIN